MILVFTNTRAELIKMSPLIKEMEKEKLTFAIIATGQHNLEDLSKKFDININYILTPPSASSRFGFSKLKALKFALSVILKFKNYIKLYGDVKYVIVHGDTLSTAIVSIASYINKIPLMHIESGLNSFNVREPFPEELCRRIAIRLSKYNFTPTHESWIRLMNTKHLDRHRIIYTGNTIYDVLKGYGDKPHKMGRGNYVVASIHRQENMNNKTRMRIIVNALNYCNIKVILFAHDPFLLALKKYKLKLNRNVNIKKLTTHEEFIGYLMDSDFVIGDGGSIQEECAYYNKPYVMLRAWTERKELDTRPGASKTIVKVIKQLI